MAAPAGKKNKRNPGLGRSPPRRVPGQLPAWNRSSGLVVSADGLVLCPLRLTGWPNKPDRALTVDFLDGTECRAELLGYDERLRFALLRIEKTGLVPLAPAPEDDVRAGRFAIAIGFPHENPRGATPQVTVGIVSRTDALSTLLHPAFRAVQTDAGVGGGNRGGPLVDLDGRLLGVILDVNDTERKGYVTRGRASYSDNAGLGFAVPMGVLRPLLPRLAEGCVFRRAILGVRLIEGEGGLHVVRVDKDKPAARAGIAVGDVIVSVADYATLRLLDLGRALLTYTVGDTVTVVIVREGKRNTVGVKLAAG